MKPRRTPQTDVVYRLVDGNEDSDLWCRRGREDEMPYIESVWEPTPEERAAIAAGATIELRVWHELTPPVSLAVGPSLEQRKADAR